MSITVLRKAVDTLELSYSGTVREPVLLALEQCKLEAQETEIPMAIDLCGIDFAIQPQGGKPYRYRLVSDEATIRATDSPKLPGAHVRLSALGLAMYDPRELYLLLSEIISTYFGPGAPKVSRIDIAVDFQGFDLTHLGAARFVCPATFRPVYPNIDHPETYTFGKGDLVVRVYNKSRELSVSGKVWMHSVWENCEGYLPNVDVWRFEVQYRRHVLRELEAGTPDSAFDQIPELLRYGLGWCDLRVPNGPRSDRWPRHPAWATLATASGTEALLTREALAVCDADLTRIVPMVAGYTTSAGIDLHSSDFEQVWCILGDRVRKRLNERGGFPEAVRTRRLLRLGKRR